MKERIEKKLGYSIEEYYKRLRKKIEDGKRKDWETEEPSDLSDFSIEEIQFIADYEKQLNAA